MLDNLDHLDNNDRKIVHFLICIDFLRNSKAQNGTMKNGNMKLFFQILIIITFVLLGSLIKFFSTKKMHQKIIAIITSYYSIFFLKTFNVKITHLGCAPAKSPFLVANHTGTLDILVLSSGLPSRFITSTDTDGDGIAGYISRAAGCLLVNRKDRSFREKEIQSISEAIDSSSSIVFFPEGTSTNGETVLPFKAGLMPAVIKTESQIQAATIKYKKINGSIIDFKNRDYIYYYGDMKFGAHLKSLTHIKSLEVEIYWHSPIKTYSTDDPKILAQKLYDQVISKF